MTIPALPGTLPVPEGHVRRFHATGNNNLEAIRREGLKYSSAKGVEGPKAIYSWPDYKSAERYAGLEDSDSTAGIVEFHTHASSFKDHPYAQLNDVPPEHILGVHEGWHNSYRHAKENNLTSKELRDVGMPRYDRVADELDSEKVTEFVNTVVDALLSEAFVARPKGWEAGSDAVGLVTKPGHAYRGMTSDEYSATVGAGKGIKSNQAFSVPGEGTSFSRDFADAESYANFGHTDPRKTGKSNFAVEITHGDDLVSSRDGYLKAQSEIPHERITRKWRFDPVDGEIHAHAI